MSSADFLVSSLITLDTRISLGHTSGCFLHSLPAFPVQPESNVGFLPLCTHCRVENTVDCRKTICKDYRLHIEPFRHSVTGDALLSATKGGFAPPSPMRCQAHLFCTRPGNVFTVV